LAGNFKFITGPMFCGKTEELIRIATRYSIANKSVLICKPKKDDRYGKGVICSHNEKALQAQEIDKLEDILPKLYNYHGGYDAVFVDEIQFVKEVDISIIRGITEDLNINFYASGLTLDSFRVPFDEILNILPYAEILQLTSVCIFCGSFSAIYTCRNDETQKEQVLVGGKEVYSAICANCHQKREN